MSGDELDELSDLTFIIVMIESAAALENVEAIAAVEGIDMLLVGCADLSLDFGIGGQIDHPMIRDACLRIAQVCRSRAKHFGVGGAAAHPELLRELLQHGAKFISGGVDQAMLMRAATTQVDALRRLVAEPSA